MVEVKKRPRSTLRSSLGFLLIANALPLGAGAWVLIQRARGKIVLEAAPAGTGDTLIVLGVAVVALVAVASFSLPAAHDLVERFRTGLAARKAILGGAAPGSRVLALLLIPPLALGYAVTWPIRLALILLALALILVALVFVIRLPRPDFLDQQITAALAYRWW